MRRWKMLKLINSFKLVGVLLFAFALAGCDKVPAGNVGVKVFLLGGEKGVDHVELGVGRYWIGFNEDLFIFPTFTQNYNWTQSRSEGSENDESITFQTVEGLSLGADVGISYAINPEMVSSVFVKYRRGINEITDTFLRNMVRDAFVAEASTLGVEAVYGTGKIALITAVEDRVRSQVSDIGINIERIYFIGELRLPPAVTAAINAKIEATQKSQTRRNEVAMAKAEADKVIEHARGAAESVLLAASAEATAINLKGEALRKNPEILQLNALEKWDGTLPKFLGGQEPMPFIDLAVAN